MNLRIDGILEDDDLMSVINTVDDMETMDRICCTEKKVVILDLQVSSDSLDIVVYLFFKAIYEYKSKRDSSTNVI